MTTPYPHPGKNRIDNPGIGMARFFSPKNLCRYRKLASDSIDVGERIQVMEVLAKEMREFRRETRLLVERHLP